MNFKELINRAIYYPQLYCNPKTFVCSSVEHAVAYVREDFKLEFEAEPRTVAEAVIRFDVEVMTGFYLAGYSNFAALILNRHNPDLSLSISYENALTLMARGDLEYQRLGIVIKPGTMAMMPYLVPEDIFNELREAHQVAYSRHRLPPCGQTISVSARLDEKFVSLYANEEQLVVWSIAREAIDRFRWERTGVVPAGERIELNQEVAYGLSQGHGLQYSALLTTDDIDTRPLPEQALCSELALTTVFALTDRFRIKSVVPLTYTVKGRTGRMAEANFKVTRRKDGKITFVPRDRGFSALFKAECDSIAELAQVLEEFRSNCTATISSVLAPSVLIIE